MDWLPKIATSNCSIKMPYATVPNLVMSDAVYKMVPMQGTSSPSRPNDNPLGFARGKLVVDCHCGSECPLTRIQHASLLDFKLQIFHGRNMFKIRYTHRKFDTKHSIYISLCTDYGNKSKTYIMLCYKQRKETT